jgi:hypothetical protein
VELLTIEHYFNKAGFPDSQFEINDIPASATGSIESSDSPISTTFAFVKADIRADLETL